MFGQIAAPSYPGMNQTLLPQHSTASARSRQSRMCHARNSIAWEERDHLIAPLRNRRGVRLYSERDLLHIEQLRRLILEHHIAPEVIKTLDELDYRPARLMRQGTRVAVQRMQRMVVALEHVERSLARTMDAWFEKSQTREAWMTTLCEQLRHDLLVTAVQMVLHQPDGGMQQVGNTPRADLNTAMLEVASLSDSLDAEQDILTGRGQHVSAFPLVYGNRCFGSFVIACPQSLALSPRELRMVALIASRIAATLAHAETYERMQSFEAYMDANPDGIIIKDANQQVIFYNITAAKMALNYADFLAATAAGKPLPILVWDTTLPDGKPIPPHEIPSIRAAISGQPVINKVMELHTDADNGAAIPVLATALSVNDGYSDQRKTLITIRDISNIKELERYRQNYYRRCVHDLRGGPLTYSRFSVDVVQQTLKRWRDDEIAPEEALSIIEDFNGGAQNAIDKICGSVSTLLDELGDPECISGEMSTMSLFEFVSTLVSDVRMSVGKARIRFITESADTQLIGKWCREQIESVIKNLVNNALDYSTDDRPIDIFLFGRKAINGRHMAHLLVQDYGCGIADDDIEHIFEEGYRGSNAEPHGVQRSGLGLAFCRKIVNAHEGYLSVKSDGPGKGAHSHCGCRSAIESSLLVRG